MVHVASSEMSVEGIEALKALPPIIWCIWGVGAWPGLTSLSWNAVSSPVFFSGSGCEKGIRVKPLYCELLAAKAQVADAAEAPELGLRSTCEEKSRREAHSAQDTIPVKNV